jgi:CRISPR-associated endonuclease Csn1
VGDFKEALKQGIWMLDNKGNKVNKIRRVRIEVRTKNALPLKKQTYLSTKPLINLNNRDHKESYWVENKERPYYAMYEKNGELIHDTLSLKNVSERKSKSLISVKKLDDLLEQKKDDGSVLQFTLTKGQKIIFLNEAVELIKKLPDYYLNTLYKVEGFEENGRMRLQHHLISKEIKEIKKDMELRGLPKDGGTEVDFNNPIPLLRPRLYLKKQGKQLYNIAIEDKHFEVKPDGKIKWFFK